MNFTCKDILWSCQGGVSRGDTMRVSRQMINDKRFTGKRLKYNGFKTKGSRKH